MLVGLATSASMLIVLDRPRLRNGTSLASVMTTPFEGYTMTFYERGRLRFVRLFDVDGKMCRTDLAAFRDATRGTNKTLAR